MWKNCDHKQQLRECSIDTKIQIPIFATRYYPVGFLPRLVDNSSSIELLKPKHYAILKSSCVRPCVSASSNLADTQWQLYPGAGAGRWSEPGDIGWWSNNDGDVATRACLFDDIYAFNADGSFQNILGDETWVEGWQTGAGEMCGAPVAPHDGSAAAFWSVAGSELTLDGVGASWALPKCSMEANSATLLTLQLRSLTQTSLTTM